MSARGPARAGWGVVGRPRTGPDEVTALLRQVWGVTATVRPLPSERDQNWAVLVDGWPRHVLKLLNRFEPAGALDLQLWLLDRLSAAGLPVPGLVRTPDGSAWVDCGGHDAWLVEHLPGTVLAGVPHPDATLWHDLGAQAGRLTRALDGADHPAAHRYLEWDLAHAAEVIGSRLGTVRDDRRRALLEPWLEHHVRHTVPRLADLPRAVIHNDLNDHNVLVHDGAVSGIIDLGDAVHGVRVHDLAVACAYAMLDRPEPGAVAAALVAGYSSRWPLTPAERAVLPDLVRTRLATSVAISSARRAAEGDEADDDYLHVTQAPAWRLLERWESEVRWTPT